MPSSFDQRQCPKTAFTMVGRVTSTDHHQQVGRLVALAESPKGGHCSGRQRHHKWRSFAGMPPCARNSQAKVGFNAATSRTPLARWGAAPRAAFTMVELLAAIAIIAVLVAVIVPTVGNYVQTARKTADKQTLMVLNDALTRYKTQGGDLSALTSGASIGNVLQAMKTPVTWAGVGHRFLNTGVTYAAADLSAVGDGAHYKFTRYGDYADGTEYSNGIISSYAANGYDVGDEEEFKSWLAQAMDETGSTNYLALENPDTTTLFEIRVRVASSGDKVRVWWGDGTTQDYDSISNSANTTISKSWASGANRSIVIVGDLSHMLISSTNLAAREVRGDISTMTSFTYLYLPSYWDGSTWNSTGIPFYGDISKLTNLEYVVADGATALTGDVSGLTNVYYLKINGTNTVTGDVSGLAGLTHLEIQCSNTITGDISGLTGLTKIKLAGNNTVSGDVSGLTGLTWLAAYGSNMLSGDISGLTNLTLLSVWGSNTCTGDISALQNLTFLSLYGSNTCFGSVTPLSSLTYLSLAGNNAVVGSVSGMPLDYLACWGNSMLDVDSIVGVSSTATGLACFNIGDDYILNQSQVDSILVNLSTNKDAAKTRSERYIRLAGGNHAAPSATGLAAKASLEAAGWTVNTN